VTALELTNSLSDFKAHENHYRLDAQGEGRATQGWLGNHHTQPLSSGGGEWRIEKQRLAGTCSTSPLPREAGIPRAATSTPATTGAGYFEVNQKSGWRWNASSLALLCGESTQPHGVDRHPGPAAHAGAMRQVRCVVPGQSADAGAAGEREGPAREVVLAGAVNSPLYSAASGIGPAGCRASMVLKWRWICPAGDNCKTILQIRTVFSVGPKHQHIGQLQGQGPDRSGIRAQGTNMSMALQPVWRLHPQQFQTSPHANLEYHANAQPRRWRSVSVSSPRVSVCNKLNPTSRGHVRIRSPRWDEVPAIALLSRLEDRQAAHTCV
jgi:choline dehydrogenase